MLRYYRVPGLGLTRSAKRSSRPVKAVKSPARVTEVWACYPHVEVARKYIVDAGPPLSQGCSRHAVRLFRQLTARVQQLNLVLTAEGYDLTKQYQEALRWERACKAGGVCPPDIKELLRCDEDTLSEPGFQKMAEWAHQWGSKVFRKSMMLEYGQPIPPWSLARPRFGKLYKDREMTEEDWKEQEESWNCLARIWT
ncbi:hypothetical protein JCM10296v2_003147 [Rhodotorula toruloides]